MDEFERFVTRVVHRLETINDVANARTFMAQVGADLVSKARSRVTRQRIVDTGRLLNSLAFRMEAGTNEVSVVAGAFGVKYAAAHEFGMHYTPMMLRAMFASLNNRGLLGKRAGKGVMVGGTLPPRPFLRPAFREVSENFAAKFRDYLRSLPSG